MPIKNVANDSETFGTSVPKSKAIALNPGKYMSIEKGAKAAKEPSIIINKSDFDFAMFLKRVQR